MLKVKKIGISRITRMAKKAGFHRVRVHDDNFVFSLMKIEVAYHGERSGMYSEPLDTFPLIPKDAGKEVPSEIVFNSAVRDPGCEMYFGTWSMESCLKMINQAGTKGMTLGKIIEDRSEDKNFTHIFLIIPGDTTLQIMYKKR
jgi:hypothetical protein